jgi:hypothetical protein
MKHITRLPELTSLKLSGSLIVLMSLAVSLTFTASAKAGTPMTGGGQGSKSAAREVVNKLVAEDFEGVRANFNEQMKQGLSAEQMKQVWRAAIQYHGAYKSQGEAVNSQQQGYDVYTIRCEMERSPMEVIVAYDQNGKIGGLWIRPAAS